MMTRLVLREWQSCFSYRLYQMRGVVEPVIRHSGNKICHLQWHNQVFTLTNGNRVNIRKLPRTIFISTIIVGWSGDEPIFFIWQINSQPTAKTETVDMLVPFS